MSLRGCFGVVLCVLPFTASGQTVGQEDGTYRLAVHSRLIETTLLVRGPEGKPVTGLQQAAIHVREDGEDQTIRYFATKRELPLSIGLIADVSGSQEKFAKEHEREIADFLRAVMAPGDRAFAVCFGNHLRLASDWTTFPESIVDGVRRGTKGDRNLPELGPKEDRELGTALYDAIVFPLRERMSREQGRRRVLIVLSDGEENSSEHDLIDAITEAQGTDTLVYALRTTENRNDRMKARDRYGERVLHHLTEATGGRSFDVGTMDTRAIFASIAEDLQSLYEVGYYSTHREQDIGFRKVDISVDGEGRSVQARAGYVAQGKATRVLR